MKKFILILMTFLPLALAAQVSTTGTTATSVNPTTGLDRATGVTLINAKTGLTELLNRYSDNFRYSFFEVSEDMFKAFCELEYADSTSIALFKKIKSVKMLEVQYTPEELKKMEKKNAVTPYADSWFYDDITSELDITGYNQLLKSRNNHSMALFLKKEFGPGDNEFLLITDKMVIDIRGDIMIKTIYQMEEMMGYVQQILPN
ncbi:MAG: hypothetical protein D4R64_15770 [Porphyromonadaceae bacterium]|nr:MAG: hypothetical protein D4R64_15770 [Porphyromonadaceae bacterium]